MKVLLAESGASKTEWRLLSEKKVLLAFRTEGLNPNNLQAAEPEKRLLTQVVPPLKAAGLLPDKVIFYGAGCGSELNRFRMTQLLVQCLFGAPVLVEHDLLAAARACARNAPGIVCILGTGSNSCLFDGKYLIDAKGGDGYLLGDEGSATDLGRQLLKILIQNRVPGLKERFEDLTGNSAEKVFSDLYSSDRPAGILSGLTPVLNELRTDFPDLQTAVADRFEAFFSETIEHYSGYETIPIHFTGSVAIHFREILEKLLTRRGLKIGNFIPDPIEALTDYHLCES